MANNGWFLHVKQSIFTGDYYIHHKAKYHRFENDSSLCGGYHMDTDFFETNNITDEYVENNNSKVCKKCYKKWNKI